jgi:LemA protein
MKNALIVIVILMVVVVGWGVATNNRLVTLNESINGSWAQVETVLQRRYDLIPNLVNTVKGYAKHESSVLEEVTRLRSQWGAAKTADEKVAAANQLEGALARLMVVIERYPDLKANQSFLALQDELAGTENRIAVERRRYNQTVQAYNTAVSKFPASMVAGLRGFQRREVYFKAAEAAKEVPKVEF